MVESLSKRIASSLEVDRVSCYQKLLDRIRDLAWIMDTAGRIHLGNNSWQNYTGVRRSPSKTYFLWDLIEPEQKAKIQQLWLNCDRESDVWEHQLRLKNLAGNYTLFNLEIERLTAADNHCSWLICTATSAADKVADELAREYGLASGDQNYKQKELNLIRNAEFIRRILESSQDCIKVLDLQGRLLYMNGRGQDLMEIDNFAQVQYEP
ncbi:MAG: PAS domain-containing protein [Pleurocapsa sp. MO_226.B13]|nr:PAS domain-containing protein [Pleurocapsa sp. MO_226.B13]